MNIGYIGLLCIVDVGLFAVKSLITFALFYFGIHIVFKNKKRKLKTQPKAKQFVDDVGVIAKKYRLPVFVVTDGASLTDNNGCEAVEHARAAHKDWELKNNITDDGGEK
jgi:hypothetical protein|nr:MAG TPA: hypothetical protein [Caudoviricetes sp.]